MNDRPYVMRSDGSVAYGRTVRARDWILSLAPRDLSWIRVDHQTRLQFEDADVVIGGEFTLHSDGATRHLDPGQRRELGPVLALYPDRVNAASIQTDGTLDLEFDSGARITVLPDLHYEPWQISGPGDRLVVCLPGASGDLAVWEQRVGHG
jgi:hypothetical protein